MCEFSPEAESNLQHSEWLKNTTAEVDKKLSKEVSAISPLHELFSLIIGPKINKTRACLLLIKALLVVYPEAALMSVQTR